MTTQATQDTTASQDTIEDMDKLFAEAAGDTTSTAAAEEGAEETTTEQPVTESKTVKEGDLDLSDNTVKVEATETAATIEGEQKPATEAAKAPPADWRANLAPEVKAEIEKIEAERARAAEENERLQHRARSDAGRVAALTRAQVDLQKRVKEVDSAKAAERKALIEQLKADYPQIAAGLEALQQEQDVRIASAETLAQELARKAVADEAAKRFASVEAKHKGWMATIKTPAFAAWKDKQPPEVQALGASDEPADAIAMLNRFREAHPATSEVTQDTTTTTTTTTAAKPSKTAAEIKADRAKTLAASGGPATRPATRESTTTVPDEVDAAFGHFASQKDKQAAASRR
jgi:hypothetical protein